MIKWLDIIDQQQLQRLVNTYNLQLTTSTISFLESFARLVNNASTTRQRLVNEAATRKTDLHKVNAIIAEEVTSLQETFQHCHIIPYRHPETSLPIVYVRVQACPDLVVHIYRSYAHTKNRLTFGFRAYSFCRGHLTGPLARATNYLRARCEANSWNFSLTQLVSLWCHQISNIPISERQSPHTTKPRMFRRRRLEKRLESPPGVVDTDHASIPQNHPKTDVRIKDDTLFPDRTFDDPEELYKEQVRAIRKKRKPVPGVLDDYELACKKRRPKADNPISEQQRPQSDPHHSVQQRSLFPVQSVDNPPESDIQQTPSNKPVAPEQPESDNRETPSDKPASLEQPEFTFHNPLSPELKHSSASQTPSPTEDIDKQIQDQDAAKMEAAERAVLTKPASKNTSSNTPDTDNTTCINDDNSPTLFFFSTTGDTNTPPVVPTRVAAEEVVTAEGIVEATVKTPPPEEKEEPAVAAPLGTEETDVTIPQTEVTQPSKEDAPTLPKEQHIEPGQIDKGNIVKASFSFEQRFDDQGVSQVGNVDKVDKEAPKTVGERTEEDSVRQADSNSPKRINVLDASEQLPKKIVKKTLENADAKDNSSKQETAGIVPPAITGRLSDSSSVTPNEAKKRAREINYSDDIIIVDPDSDEENEKNAKKRRLGNSAPQEKIDSPVDDPKSDRPSPRNVDLSTPQRTVRSPEKDTDESRSPDKDTDESRETKPVQEVRQSITKEATREVVRPNVSKEVTVQEVRPSVTKEVSVQEVLPSITKEVTREVVRPSVAKEVTRDVAVPDPRPFSGYSAVSIPAGVDCDPCPMALSEPSESSEYSSDRGSNSDAGSISDGQSDER